MRNNLINSGQFEKRRPATYVANRDRELEELVVLGAIENNAKTSTRQLAQTTGLPRTTCRSILKKHSFRPFRTRKVQYLRPEDFQQRLIFSQWFLEKCNLDRDFPLNCIWTDESYISSAGIFKRYNSYTWAQQNPHSVVEQRNQGRFGFSVWAGIYRGRIVGPFMYDGTLTTDKYLQILREQIELFIDELPLAQRRNIYFQHDGAPPHNGAIINNFLNATFGNNWIGNRGPTLWPARSPDLTPMDYFLWGKLKDILYQMPRSNREELENAVLQSFISLTPVELINSTRAIQKRCRVCVAENGRQFENLL